MFLKPSRKAGTVSALTHTPSWGVRQCSWVQAHVGAPQVSTRISFLDNKKVLPVPQAGHPLHHGIEGATAVVTTP